MTKRNIYLDNKPLEEALQLYLDKVKALSEGLESEGIAVDEARGRITTEAVFAKLSSPHYHASAMDGIAIKASSTFSATETKPLHFKVDEAAFPVDTGDPLPEGCDAVIMIENIHYVDDKTVEIINSVSPWQHVRVIGEDIVTTEMIVPANHTLSPYDIGALLAGGVTEVMVRKHPKVTVIPTGTELVQPGTQVKPGDIIEYNSRLLGGLITEWGGQVSRHAIVKDDYELLRSTLQEVVKKSDLVVINAGSSAGSEDYTAAIIAELGEVLVHGVAIKPGKPVILGLVDNKPVIGVPGYPVSAALTCELFVKPVLGFLQGVALPERNRLQAVISRRVVSPLGSDEFMRVKLGQVGEKIVATPMSRGAGVIMSMVKADGLLKIPRLTEGYEAGTMVDVSLIRSEEGIKKTTVAVGSHDITLDILADYLRKKSPERTLASAHVGSLGGIMALKRGEAHLAGIHLLDEETGEYNHSYLKKYLGNSCYLVNLVHRDQGLIVAKGNPLGITGLQDLVEKRAQFINRQRGAGTRILLDYQLKTLGLDAEELIGYEREEFTHMSIAAAVASGSADAGLGIYAAAKALDLDFIPIAKERYDLAIPKEFWPTPYIQELMAILQDENFKASVEQLGGYDTQQMGELIPY